MQHIWNIYESGDPDCPGPDPFDVFLYAIRKDEEPRYADLLYVEGQRCRVIAVAEDRGRNEVAASEEERYWKICVRQD